MPSAPPSFRYFGPTDRPAPPSGKTRGKPILAVALAVIFGLSSAAGAGAWFLYRIYESLPATLSQLENIDPPLVTRVVAKDGTVIHEFSTERRFWVPIDRMPANLIKAVVAIEDRRFYDHWGIDVKRIIGAVLVDLVHRGYAQGASTLTQQLARNLYLTARQSMIRKVREILTAIQIERRYTKREILELYLNQVYLGAGAYGMEAASQRYFGKPVSSLNLNECAVLAGTIQLPEFYRPDKKGNVKRVTARRNAVLAAMRKMHYIDRATARTALRDSIVVNPQEPVSREAPYFVEMVRQHVAEKYGEDLLYGGGLTIQTTLDPLGQDSAESGAARHLKVLQKRLNRMFVDSAQAFRIVGIPRDTFIAHFDSIYRANKQKFVGLADSVRLRTAQVGLVAFDVKTGAIRAFMGGRDYEESKYNRVIQSLRQPGSAFKAFVYTAAMDSGFTPFTVVLDQPITLATPQGEWRPENYDKEFLGPITIRKALYKSINLVAIQVLNEVGAQKVVSYAHRMGIRNDLDPVPSLAIGACEVVPIEITAAYGIFPNGGRLVQPYCIERITDKNGKVLEEHTPVSREVLSPQTSFIMCSLLSDVTTRGTAAAIPGLGFRRPSAGKTGTTNDYTDAWFIGFTPQIVCGVWVGVDEKRSLGRGVNGAEGAVPIWVKAMIGLHNGLPVRYFQKPPGVVYTRICEESHKIATKSCPQVRDDYYIEGAAVDTCDVHGPRHHGKGGDFMDTFGTAGKREKSGGKRRPLMF